jgi:hypothetical protein
VAQAVVHMKLIQPIQEGQQASEGLAVAVQRGVAGSIHAPILPA